MCIREWFKGEAGEEGFDEVLRGEEFKEVVCLYGKWFSFSEEDCANVMHPVAMTKKGLASAQMHWLDL